jgi:hypothetical protein
MRTFALFLCLLACASPALAQAHREAQVRQGTQRAPSHGLDRLLEELRATKDHTDYYLVLHLEIEALRRDNPEHSEFLSRYLQSLLSK